MLLSDANLTASTALMSFVHTLHDPAVIVPIYPSSKRYTTNFSSIQGFIEDKLTIK
jgi:hypothetical protein